ncbi:MAG: tetratricopeptide repeat protein [Candidatus Aminicenantes bacterium]|nr:tetratricopeptide repeat protein [Candidatus Aminicenantes bacterium]
MKKFLLLLSLAGVSVSLLAQTGMIGAIKGTVRDGKTQALLADVKIVVTDPQSKGKHEVRTDKDGYAYMSGLYPGNYEITFEKEGYVPASTTLRLAPGETRDINLTLEPALQAEKGAGLFNKGLQLVNEEKYTDAVGAFSQSLVENSGNFLAYYYRGFCQEKQGNADAALPDYIKTVELKPDFVLGLASLAKVYAKKGDFAKAVVHYKKVYDLGTTDTNSLYNYGVSLVNLGKNAEAKTMFEKVLTIDATHADACYQLGLILLGLGDMAKAKECLKTFLALAPEHKDAATAKAIIDSLK